MTLSRLIGTQLALLFLISLAVNADAAVKLSPSQRYANNVKRHSIKYQQRRLQKNNNGKNDDNERTDNGGKNNGGGKNNDNTVVTLAPSTVPPSSAPPTVGPTPFPTESTPLPTEPPTEPPTLPPATTVPEVDVWTTPGQSFGVTLSTDKLRDIQYFGGGQITLRFSLWFQDDMTASQVGSGPIMLAVLHSLQRVMCQPDVDTDDLDPLGLSTLDWADASEAEERELCVMPAELGGAGIFSAQTDGSVLLQPPTTFVVDRTASGTNLHWTTWRVTWDVLRLGTSYILQGLENAGANSETLEEQEIYRAGLDALQGILELALQVSIREQSYDKILVGSMVEVGQTEGMVLSSVYGEEVTTLEPKLEWLGLNSGSTTEPEGEDPTSVASSQGETTESTAETATSMSDAIEEDDDRWDDDQYSMVYGITEKLDPPFWHPLRIVGIFMFFFTVACLVALSHMSKKRLARREIERKMAKEGLLNNPQGVEDMLKSSDMRLATDEVPNPPTFTNSGSHDEAGVSIPMPSNLEVNSS